MPFCLTCALGDTCHQIGSSGCTGVCPANKGVSLRTLVLTITEPPIDWTAWWDRASNLFIPFACQYVYAFGSNVTDT